VNPVLLGSSLLAVLATAGLVALLGLGKGAAIEEPARLAEDLLPGFESEDTFASEDRRAALVRGRAGDWALLRVHGAHPVARRLAGRPQMERAGDAVRVSCDGQVSSGEPAVLIRNDKLLTLL